MCESVNEQSTEAGDFQFVTGSNRRALRSHAMKSHWRLRKQQASGPRRASIDSQLRLQPLRPRVHQSGASLTQAERASGTEPAGLVSCGELSSIGDLTPAASEVFCSMIKILGGGTLDPFDSLPVRLATVHHKLLYHWISMGATKISSYLPASIISTVRDIRLPLDLSNAASFNVCMAHAAAHMAQTKGQRCSTTALEFKLEAMRIIAEWIRNKAKALSDDMFVAVLRLLKYEQQWGTESDWQIHRRGLLQILGARGGVEALASNWRLALTTYLTTLMVRRTWFDSSNHISGLLAPQSLRRLELVTGDGSAAARLRCLWLLSLCQEMEYFALQSMEKDCNVLEEYTNLQDALLLLLVEMEQDNADGNRGASMSDAEFRRLACVFFIAILYRTAIESEVSTLSQTSLVTPLSAVIALDAHLSEYSDTWRWDVEGLYITLFNGFFTVDAGIPDRDYVFSMISVLKSLTSAARQGIESCILYVMCQRSAESAEQIIDSNMFIESI